MKVENSITFQRDPHLPGMEICTASSSRHVFSRHSHEDLYAISLMERGGSYWDGRGKSASLVSPGEIAVINPGEPHSGEPVQRSGSTYRMIYLRTHLFQDEGAHPQLSNLIKGDTVLIKLFNDLFASLNPEFDPLEKETALVSFTGYLKNYSLIPITTTEPGNDKRTIKKAEDLLASDLFRKISLEEVAGECGFSNYHFLRLFKKHTGVTPHLYRTQYRLEKAKKMILKGIPIASIAAETGFSDQSHFARTFKKFTGATPGQYLSGQ